MKNSCVMKKRERTSSICPRCLENELTDCPALSRRDNKTHICSQCGTEEALIDIGMPLLPETPETLEREELFIIAIEKGDANET